MSADRIVQELLSRGVPPEEIERINPALGQRARTGMVAPRIAAPDKVAERGAYIRDYGKLSERREAFLPHQSKATNLDRFQQLNRVQPTGGWMEQQIDGWERVNPLNWPSMLGQSIIKYDPEYQEMSGIASGLQGAARPSGSGATSDFEQRLYRMGVPSPEKKGPVNGSIVNYMRGVVQEENDRLAFDEEFMRRNGSLSGSAEAWSRYVSANPYTTIRPSDGRVNPNANRKDWRTHFGVGGAARGAPARSPAANAPRKDPFPGIRDGQIVEQGGRRYRRQGAQMVPVN